MLSQIYTLWQRTRKRRKNKNENEFFKSYVKAATCYSSYVLPQYNLHTGTCTYVNTCLCTVWLTHKSSLYRDKFKAYMYTVAPPWVNIQHINLLCKASIEDKIPYYKTDGWWQLNTNFNRATTTKIALLSWDFSHHLHVHVLMYMYMLVLARRSLCAKWPLKRTQFDHWEIPCVDLVCFL